MFFWLALLLHEQSLTNHGLGKYLDCLTRPSARSSFASFLVGNQNRPQQMGEVEFFPKTSPKRQKKILEWKLFNESKSMQDPKNSFPSGLRGQECQETPQVFVSKCAVLGLPGVAGGCRGLPGLPATPGDGDADFPKSGWFPTKIYQVIQNSIILWGVTWISWVLQQEWFFPEFLSKFPSTNPTETCWKSVLGRLRHFVWIVYRDFGHTTVVCGV